MIAFRAANRARGGKTRFAIGSATNPEGRFQFGAGFSGSAAGSLPQIVATLETIAATDAKLRAGAEVPLVAMRAGGTANRTGRCRAITCFAFTTDTDRLSILIGGVFDALLAIAATNRIAAYRATGLVSGGATDPRPFSGEEFRFVTILSTGAANQIATSVVTTDRAIVTTDTQ